MKNKIVHLVTLCLASWFLLGCGKHDHDHDGHSDHDHGDHADAATADTNWQPKMVGEDSHPEHGDHPFEWLGLFELQEGEYTWTFSKVDGKYADPYMSMAVLNAEDSTEIDESKAQAERLLASLDKAKLQDGAVLLSGKAYELYFDQQKEVTSFKIKIATLGHYLFYTEHMPIEFEAEEHFFKDSTGNDIEPLKEEYVAGHAHGAGGHAH